MNRNNSHTSTLVLAAHGATDDPRCAAPVYRHAEAIRGLGLFEDVLTIFWKEAPHFSELHELTGSRDVLVVPIMTASGYYSNTVLPREIGFSSPSLKGGGTASRNIRIAQPIGELDGMTDIIIEQAVRAATDAGIDPLEAHLLLIGHGTRRDPARSGATTYRHVAAVSARQIFSSTSAGFLEQDPEVVEAFAQIEGSEPIIIVPFLIANGGHGADDIPSALGVDPGIQVDAVNNRPVLFADAVGEHPRLVNLILQSAEQARTAQSKVA